jgi:hypothetical protein
MPTLDLVPELFTGSEAELAEVGADTKAKRRSMSFTSHPSFRLFGSGTPTTMWSLFVT